MPQGAQNSASQFARTGHMDQPPPGYSTLSPYEILFGSAPRLGCYCPQQLQLLSDILADYVTALSRELMRIRVQVFSSIPDPQFDTGTHSLVPGDSMLIKTFVQKHPLEPGYDGPFKVLLIPATSVLHTLTCGNTESVLHTLSIIR